MFDDASPDPMVPRPFRLLENRAETHDVNTLVLVPADGQPCFSFLPAQIGMIGIPGLGEVPISFSSDPADEHHVAMTIRRAGAITAALLDLDVGDLVGMRGPFGTQWPLTPAKGKRVLFVAGGLGLAPLRSAVVSCLRMAEEFESLTLAYGARSPSEMLFVDELARWGAHPSLRVLLTIDRPAPQWAGRVGFVDSLFDAGLADPMHTIVMACGPDAMLETVGGQLVDRGTRPSDIWMTLERNMKCAIGLCGHCQFGPYFLCKDGPVMSWENVGRLYQIAEV